MRALKTAGLVLGGAIVLVALLLAAVAILVDPNDYKARIEREVKSRTGRDLTLGGDIKLSVFPWIALQLGPASLGNPPGFDAEPFLSVRGAALRVKLLPLLHKELQVGKIEIDGLDLRMKRNAAGKGNWQDFGQPEAPAGTAAATAKRPESGQGGDLGPLSDLGGIAITDSRIRYQDLTISKLNLEVGNVTQRAAVPVKVAFDMDTGAAGSHAGFTGSFDATLDSASGRYALAAVTLGGEWRQKNARRAVPWKFLAPSVDLDLRAQTLRAPAFSAQFGSAALSGTLQGEKIPDAPVLDGSLKVAPLGLREFLAQFGVDLGATRDPKAFSTLAASMEFSYSQKAVRMNKLEVRLDDTELRGSAAVSILDTLQTTFDLHVDRIDLDRYRAPEAAQKAGAAPAAAASKSEPKADQKPVELPTTAVRALNLKGNFSIAAAKAAGMSLSNLRLSLQAKDGVVHLSPIKASLYGGEYSGDIVYDAHDATPSLMVDQQVTGVDIAPLLKDCLKSQRLSGHGFASTKLSGAGRTSDELTRNLSGRVEANLADGAVNGIDLGYELSRAQALLKQQPVTGSDEHRTKFDSFKMSADVAHGIATTKDLNIASQYLRVTGTGSANLVTQAIDYHLLAKVLKAPPGAASSKAAPSTLADIPVEVSGTMSDPKVRPDLKGILESTVKQKLQDTLKDKLKGLLEK